MKMDFPVEATVLLNFFHDEAKARQILRSHGFELTDLSRDQVRVKGSFLKLKDAKATLESLISSQATTDIAPSPAQSPTLKVSSGAISKHTYTNDKGGTRSRIGSPKQPQNGVTGFSNNRPNSPEIRAFSPSPRPDRQCSVRLIRETFVIDADVFRCAKRLRKKDMDAILDSHNVKMEVCEVGDSFNVTLLGRSARTAVVKLQSLLNDLNKSLRTQEVRIEQVDKEGWALFEKIRKNQNIYQSVLVCPNTDKIHLVGPSGESYELKQRLLGRPVDQSGRTGRTLDKNSRKRSTSLPPACRNNTTRDSGATANATANALPMGATGYSPSKYQDNKQQGAESDWKAADCFGRCRDRRSQSESRDKTRPDRSSGYGQVTESKHPPPKSPKKGLQPLLDLNANLKKQFKKLRKR